MAALEASGIASVMVASAEFVDAAATQAASLGVDPRRVFVPHPIQDRTDGELRRIADDVVEELLRALVEDPSSGE